MGEKMYDEAIRGGLIPFFVAVCTSTWFCIYNNKV